MIEPLRTSLYLDSSRVRSNIKALSKLHPQRFITPVLKANAYGHGIDKILSLIDGQFDTVAVATLEEAKPFIDSKSTFKILHGPMSVEELAYDNKVYFVIGRAQQLKMISHYNNAAAHRYWLKVDLGLNRLGFSLSDAREILNTTPQLWRGIVGHLGAVDVYPDLSSHQAYQLKALASEFNLPLSLENTEGFSRWKNSPIGHYVRLGLVFYGYTKNSSLPVLPIGTLRSKMIKTFPRGSKLMGYEWSHRTANPVSLVSIGYGDGLSPHLTGYVLNKGGVRVRDPLMMDLCYLEHLNEAPKNNYIEWFGHRADELLAMSKYLNVKPYVILSQLTNRVSRQVVESCHKAQIKEVML